MLALIVIVCVYLFLQMCVVWALYRYTKNPSIVDVSWSLGLMVAGLIYLFSVPFTSRTGLLSGLLILWALRLAIYLWYARIRRGIVDKRYLTLSENWKISPSLGFFFNFQLQAFFILIMSSVFLFAAYAPITQIGLFDLIGLVLVLLGIAGESIADWQLQTFKAHHSGEVCQVGLWRFTRHPNYFFDWVTWCGFTCFGLSHSYGWLGIVSPLFLYILFNYITGPMTERGSLASRGDKYRQYQAQTSMFFPWKRLS